MKVPAMACFNILFWLKFNTCITLTKLFSLISSDDMADVLILSLHASLPHKAGI